MPLTYTDMDGQSVPVGRESGEPDLPFDPQVVQSQSRTVKAIVDACAQHDITDGVRLYAFISWYNAARLQIGRKDALAEVLQRIAGEWLPKGADHAEIAA